MSLFAKTVLIAAVFNALLFIIAVSNGNMLLITALVIILELLFGILLLIGKVKPVGQGMLLVAGVSFLIGMSICSQLGCWLN